jgi:hypothetical protein
MVGEAVGEAPVWIRRWWRRSRSRRAGRGKKIPAGFGYKGGSRAIKTKVVATGDVNYVSRPVATDE